MLIDSNIDKLWLTFSQEISKTALVGHRGRVNAIAISHDANFIVTATNDHTACIWRAGNCIRLIGHNAPINCLTISSDNKFIATGSADGTAAIWDGQTGKHLVQLMGHTNSINSIDISPDNKFIVTGSSDNTACLWNPWNTHSALICQLIGHTQKINVVRLLPDNSILTASDDKTVLVWNMQGRCIKNFLHRAEVTNIIRPYQNYFFIEGFSDSAAHFFAPEKGFYLVDSCGEKNCRTLPMHRWQMRCFSDKELSLHLASSRNRIAIYNRGSRTWFDFGCHRSHITAAEISPDLSFVVSGSKKDNVIYIWSIRPKIDQLLSREISIKKLIFILELNEKPKQQ